MADILYTYTDESPALATYSFYPIVKEFLFRAGIDIDLLDISLANRILSLVNGKDDLKALEQLVKAPNANIIKLPNISASVVQLKEAINELREAGFSLPDYENFTPYSKALGSAINPVLREGNSNRHVSPSVKSYAKKNPHKNGKWDKSIKTKVYSMNNGDFYANEKSLIATKDSEFRIYFQEANGKKNLLKDSIMASKGDVLSISLMAAKALKDFVSKSILEADKENLLFSLHLKATMMKVSDPIIFGYFVREFFKEVIDELPKTVKINSLQELFQSQDKHIINETVIAKIKSIYKGRLAMVDSARGITNLHVPSDVIIDASMPAMIRSSGKMYDDEGNLKDTLAVIPDRTYASIYDEIINEFKDNSELDPATMGSFSNIGLMASKAEEYGSHDKTFVASCNGKFILTNDEQSLEIEADEGDIFRAMMAKKVAIDNWIKLGIESSKQAKAIIWLDENRAHDRNIIKTIGKINLPIMDYRKAIRETVKALRSAQNVVSITGNVLRDYLTDLFPILELGTSAKMLSIVPLLNGGNVFETGAGGSAPKIARQLLDENHLRWDSLGEFLALAKSLEAVDKPNAKILSSTLQKAIENYLNNDCSPKKNVGETDTRGSHFYLALYWVKELANSPLKDKFIALCKNLDENKETIVKELLTAQQSQTKTKGYYYLDKTLTSSLMRPSRTLNKFIGGLE